jgi:integrase
LLAARRLRDRLCASVGASTIQFPSISDRRHVFRYGRDQHRPVTHQELSLTGDAAKLLDKPWRVENLSRTYSRLRDLAGLPKDLVLYLARHECGTKICREKGIEYARRLLGHTNISTTQRYMHLDDSELADAQDLVE